jgi:hypothetical protein
LATNWLPVPVIQKQGWPKIKYKAKRAIKPQEHDAILAREKNPERKAFYELAYGLWEFNKHDESLAGDHQVAHIILVKRPVAAPVTAELRLSIDVGSLSLWTSARYTEWVPVTIDNPS